MVWGISNCATVGFLNFSLLLQLLPRVSRVLVLLGQGQEGKRWEMSSGGAGLGEIPGF